MRSFPQSPSERDEYIIALDTTPKTMRTRGLNFTWNTPLWNIKVAFPPFLLCWNAKTCFWKSIETCKSLRSSRLNPFFKGGSIVVLLINLKPGLCLFLYLTFTFTAIEHLLCKVLIIWEKPSQYTFSSLGFKILVVEYLKRTLTAVEFQWWSLT